MALGNQGIIGYSGANNAFGDNPLDFDQQPNLNLAACNSLFPLDPVGPDVREFNDIDIDDVFANNDN